MLEDPDLPRSCDRCHFLKERCERPIPSETSPCRRCSRLHLDCRSNRPHKRAGRPPRAYNLNRTSQPRLQSRSLAKAGSRTWTATTSTVDSTTRSTLRVLYPAGSTISQEELWHVNNILTDNSYLQEFVIGPSFCHRHRDTLVSQYDTSRSTVEDAYIALALIWGLRDTSTPSNFSLLNTCYKRASSAIMTLRSLDVRGEHHVQPCLVLGVSLLTFALKLGGTHVLPICNYILSLVKPYYEKGKQLADPDLLIVVSLNEIAECLLCARMPTLLVELPLDQAESYVNRYIGLSANILPSLYHICKISRDMAYGDAVDKDKTLNHLEEEIRRWQPSVQDSRMGEFTAKEVSHMICQASIMQTAALLIIHRLRYPYGTEDLAASAMAFSILSQLHMTQKITGRPPRCVDLPLTMACTEIPDELERRRHLRTLSPIGIFSPLFQKRVELMLKSIWAARKSSTTLYWCDLAAALS